MSMVDNEKYIWVGQGKALF